MEKKVYKFPSIEAFRSVIHNVKYRSTFIGKDEDGEPIFDGTKKLPTLDFKGTIKGHGTNGGIVWVWDPLTFEYEKQIQSREREITPLSDNAGFAAFMHLVDTNKLLTKIMKVCGDDLGYTPEVVRLYGEWCGGNIQGGVALNQLEKMFIVFAVKVDNRWLTYDEIKDIKIPEEKIYNIMDFPTYDITIDFNNPEASVSRMEEIIDEVEKECPIGKHFGVSGVGEGVVFRCVTDGWSESRYWMKIKGEKHKVSKNKTKIPVDIERLESINELVESIVTEARMKQGIDYLKEMGHEITQKSTGHYLKWLTGDVVKEEIDTILGNGFGVKEINKAVSNKGREWYFKKLDEEMGL